MSDPLRDERFPHRPQSQDFWRLSEAVLQVDGQADEGDETFEQIVSKLIDIEALTYMATSRMSLGLLRTNSKLDLSSAWLDGFVVGLLFQQKGGHRDG